MCNKEIDREREKERVGERSTIEKDAP